MSKAILVLDMPEDCSDCDLCQREDSELVGEENAEYYCCIKYMGVGGIMCDGKPDWCPLISEPKHDENGDIVWYDPTEPITEETAEKIKAIGWNACIDYLEGKNDG